MTLRSKFSSFQLSVCCSIITNTSTQEIGNIPITTLLRSAHSSGIIVFSFISNMVNSASKWLVLFSCIFLAIIVASSLPVVIMLIFIYCCCLVEGHLSGIFYYILYEEFFTFHCWTSLFTLTCHIPILVICLLAHSRHHNSLIHSVSVVTRRTKKGTEAVSTGDALSPLLLLSRCSAIGADRR